MNILGGIGASNSKNQSINNEEGTLINDDESEIEQPPRLTFTQKFHPGLTNKSSAFAHKYWNFILAPRSHFIYKYALFIVFLAVFSYFMLCVFRYDDYVPVYNANNSANSNSTIIKTERIILAPHWIFYLLIFWIFAFAFNEVVEVINLIFIIN